MARQRTKAEDIKNPEHYFNKYIAMEIKHDKVKQAEIDDIEFSLEEKSNINSFEYSVSVNKNGELYNEIVADNSEFPWIEKIKSEKLYAVIQTLSYKQKKLLTYIYFEQLTQTEAAEKMGITQSAIPQRLSTIMKKIKIFFS